MFFKEKGIHEFLATKWRHSTAKNRLKDSLSFLKEWSSRESPLHFHLDICMLVVRLIVLGNEEGENLIFPHDFTSMYAIYKTSWLLFCLLQSMRLKLISSAPTERRFNPWIGGSILASLVNNDKANFVLMCSLLRIHNTLFAPDTNLNDIYIGRN